MSQHLCAPGRRLNLIQMTYLTTITDALTREPKCGGRLIVGLVFSCDLILPPVCPRHFPTRRRERSRFLHFIFAFRRVYTYMSQQCWIISINMGEITILIYTTLPLDIQNPRISTSRPRKGIFALIKQYPATFEQLAPSSPPRNMQMKWLNW